MAGRKRIFLFVIEPLCESLDGWCTVEAMTISLFVMYGNKSKMHLTVKMSWNNLFSFWWPRKVLKTPRGWGSIWKIYIEAGTYNFGMALAGKGALGWQVSKELRNPCQTGKPLKTLGQQESPHPRQAGMAKKPLAGKKVPLKVDGNEKWGGSGWTQ